MTADHASFTHPTTDYQEKGHALGVPQRWCPPALDHGEEWQYSFCCGIGDFPARGHVYQKWQSQEGIRTTREDKVPTMKV